MINLDFIFLHNFCFANGRNSFFEQGSLRLHALNEALHTSDWDKLFFYAVRRHSIIFWYSFNLFVGFLIVSGFSWQEFLRGSSQNVCAARMLDAVDRLLDTLTAFRSGSYPTNRPQSRLRRDSGGGSGGSSAALRLPHHQFGMTADDHSSPASEGSERRTPSPSKTSNGEDGAAVTDAQYVQSLEDTTRLVAREFLLALRCWKGQIEPDKDLGHMGPGLPEMDAYVTLVDLGLAAGAPERDDSAHQAWAPVSTAQQDAHSAPECDGCSAQGDRASSGSPCLDEGDDSETEEMDPALRGAPANSETEQRALQRPKRPDASGTVFVDMAGFFRAVKAQLDLMHEGLLRGDAVAVRDAAAASRELAEGAGSRSIASRALAIEIKAGGGSGLRVADVDSLEQQIEAADAIWRSCRITV